MEHVALSRTLADTGQGRKATAGVLVSLLVLSHWLLDLLVHRHDLGLLDNEPDKLGFGLWNWPMVEMPLEIGIVLVGLWIYLSATSARSAWGHRMPWIALIVLLAMQLVNWFGPQPLSAAAFSGLGLIAYALCACVAWGLDRTRAAVPDENLPAAG